MPLALLALTGCGDGAPGGDSSTSSKAAPGVPVSPQGDNSIQTFGREGSAADRAAATATVRAYLVARAEREWAKACSRLGARARAEQGSLAGGECAVAMARFTPRRAPGALAAEARIEVLSMRRGEGRGFLIYRNRGGDILAMPLVQEGGEWRLGLVTPAPIG